MAYLEKVPAPNTSPFRRFYHHTWTDHFYTTAQPEIDYVLDYGWVDEGFEGHIYTANTPGTVPLYRLNRMGPNSDHDHFYTTSSSVKNGMVKYENWEYDGIAGYVFSTPTPVYKHGFMMGYRPELPKNYSHCNAEWSDVTRNGSNPQAWYEACLRRSQHFGAFNVADVPRPAGVTTQFVRFNFIAYNFFNSYDHFGVMLRNNTDWSGPNVYNWYYTGAGPAIGNLRAVCGYSRAMIETFWVPTQDNGIGGVSINPSSCGGALQDGVTYLGEATASDSGEVTYSIFRERAWWAPMLIASGSAQAHPDGYVPGHHGILFNLATLGGPKAFSVHFTNIQYGWR